MRVKGNIETIPILVVIGVREDNTRLLIQSGDQPLHGENLSRT